MYFIYQCKVKKISKKDNIATTGTYCLSNVATRAGRVLF
jgi:hypothetical protein